MTIVESCGLVRYDGDIYHLLVAHPGPRVYLTVILEVLSGDPPEWIGIRLDKDRIDAIILTYLRQIGAVEEENDEESEADGAPVDDTVVPGQHWKAVTGINET